MKKTSALAVLCIGLTLSQLAYAASSPRYTDPRAWRETTKNDGTREMLGQLLAIYDRLSEVSKVKAKFYVADTESLNAFASETKDGEAVIVLNIGAVEVLSKDQDAMAALIAHELGHVAKGHVKSAQSTQNVLSLLGNIAGAVINYKLGTRGVNIGSTTGDVTGFAASLVGRKFDRDQEREADDLALQWMLEAGYSPMGNVRLHRALLQENDRAESSILSTHPGARERIEAAEKFIANTPVALALKDKPLLSFAEPTNDSASKSASKTQRQPSNAVAAVDFLLNPDRACDWFAGNGMMTMMAWTQQVSADNRGYVCQYATQPPGDEDGIMLYGRASIDANEKEVYVSVSAQAFSRKRLKDPNEILTKADMENFATQDETRDALIAFAVEVLDAQGKTISPPVVELLNNGMTKSLKENGATIEYDVASWKPRRQLSLNFTVPAVAPRHKALIAALGQPAAAAAAPASGAKALAPTAKEPALPAKK